MGGATPLKSASVPHSRHERYPHVTLRVLAQRSRKKTAILPRELFRQIKARTIELGCMWCPLWPLRRTKGSRGPHTPYF